MNREIVSTPGNLLAGLYELFERDLEENAAIVFETNDWLYASVFVNGTLVTERSVEIEKFLGVREDPTAPQIQLASLLESALLAVEKRYQCIVPVVYRINNSKTPRYHAPPHRTIRELSMGDLFPGIGTGISLLHLLAVPFAREFPRPEISRKFPNRIAGVYSFVEASDSGRQKIITVCNSIRCCRAIERYRLVRLPRVHHIETAKNSFVYDRRGGSHLFI